MDSSAASLRFSEFLAAVSANIRTLLALQAQHPSAAEVRIASTNPPKSDPGVKITTAAQPSGYRKVLAGVTSKVVLTTSIESAFTTLRPLLPAGTVMTSG